MLVPLQLDERWSIDFVSGQRTDGRRFCILAVIDDCTRECLALIVDTSLSGMRVGRELDRLITERGRPTTIVSDNGREFTSNAILALICKPVGTGTPCDGNVASKFGDVSNACI
ncbi:hypothetical protein GCM10010869_00040 [Mesorhizobium tianshanense]|uniref:Putative transposase n=1 Tax=Mesorhizobium tianshanense TaxID=39844 RepID=A0A562NRG7_9HYPH|nr:putative transposase [Mesorhizobium tianshanense]GLS34416.1 hypothetical protein GCM10010869_00040 [Mesorhizobium tianshanense]